MVWEQEVSCIVMLTSEVENGKVKCACYWPTETVPILKAPFQVNLTGVRNHGSYVERRLQLLVSGLPPRTITHFLFSEWPDHGVPSSPDALLQFHHHVKSCIKQLHATSGKDVPVIVHCSAGVGRTGTFIAIDLIFELIVDQAHIDIFDIVRGMRERRNFMVI